MKRHPIRPAAPLLFGALAALLFLCGCASDGGSPEFREARSLITSGKAECVLVTSDRRLVADRGRGVSPLLNLYGKRSADLQPPAISAEGTASFLRRLVLAIKGKLFPRCGR